MDAKTVLNELIKELEALQERIIAPYKNNDNIDFIPTLYAGQYIGIEQPLSMQNLNWRR